ARRYRYARSSVLTFRSCAIRVSAQAAADGVETKRKAPMSELYDIIKTYLHHHNLWSKDFIQWIVQGLVLYLAYRLGLKAERAKRYRLVKDVTKQLDLRVKPQLFPDGVVIEVVNGSNHPIRRAIASIAISYEKNDV